MHERNYNSEPIIVRIDDVDIPQRIVHCRDKTNAAVMATFRIAGATHQVPAQGERWRICRYGSIWHLDARLDAQSEGDTLSGMQQGDVRIRTPGSLFANAYPMGSTAYNRFGSFSGATNGTQITLSFPPIDDGIAVMVFKDGVLIDPGPISNGAPTNWSVSGNTLTFKTSVAAGVLVVYYEHVQ